VIRIAKLAVVCLLFALTATARADEVEDRAAASAHFEAGVALAKRGDHKAALAEFEAAYAAVPTWEFLFNIGVTQKTVFRYGAAIRTLERYLADGGDQVPAAKRTKVDAELAELRRLVGEVVVTVDGAPARIEIDDLFEGTTPLDAPLLVAPGDHTIRAIRDGEAPDEQRISVVSGARIDVVLAPVPAAVERTTARITIVSRPSGARIRIDDGPRLPTPWTGELDAGGYRLTAELDGYEVERTDLAVIAGQERTVPIDLTPLPPPPEGGRPFYKRPVFWIVAGAVVVTAASIAIGLQLSQPEETDVVFHWGE